VPGIPRNDQPWNGGKQKGHKRQQEVAERQTKIKAAMEKMPQLIAAYRVLGLFQIWGGAGGKVGGGEAEETQMPAGGCWTTEDDQRVGGRHGGGGGEKREAGSK
jgi:hypothetical protein